MKLSLIIPCYNEAENLPLLLKQCKKITSTSSFDIEIILVDNGSTDKTPELLMNLLPNYPGCRSVRVEENKGYGFGIIAGLNAAKGEILSWTHADMQTDPQDVLRGLALFEKHGKNTFVKGQRYGRPFVDVIFSVGMSMFESLLLRKPLWDINAQPTLFSRTFFESWQDPPHDFSLDLYAYYIAQCTSLPIYRFPVKFGARAYGVSHWNVDWPSKKKFIQRTMNFSFQLRRRIKT